MFYKIILLLIVANGVNGDLSDFSRLKHILDALERGLQFMKDEVKNINLDGVFGIRRVEEQLQAFLKFEPDVFQDIYNQVGKLQDMAAYISNEGEKNVYKNEKEYSSKVGLVMRPSKRILWYPRREINIDDEVEPLPCTQSIFNENSSDTCLMHIIGSGKKNDDTCIITEECRKMNTAPKQRGYVITHQVLYWQMVEMRNCVRNISPSLQTYLCSNVMRDAEVIFRSQLPNVCQDLFMEQIGLCGMWGFENFYKPEWIDKIIKWQLPSGCFVHQEKFCCIENFGPDAKIRVKRRERILEDGCLSHKTTMALMALTVSLRFEAERLYNERMD